VDARLIFHNSGKQRSTKHPLPFILIYKEALINKEEALKIEKQIKKFKGGEAFKKLLGDVVPPQAGH
jgi:putative endonuclease